MKKEWVVKLRIGKSVTPPMRVCSVHFVASDFFWSSTDPEVWTPVRKRLKKMAVPSQCIPVRSHEHPDQCRLQAAPSVELLELHQCRMVPAEMLQLLQTFQLKMEMIQLLPTFQLKMKKEMIQLLRKFQLKKMKWHKLFLNFHWAARKMAAVLEAAIPWPDKNEISRNVPQCFTDYREVRVVLDCTEVQLEKSHCASCRILTYSHYKGVHTAKVLVGVSPAGLITFISNGFGGRASDKACVE
ncbi:uncharacterized protein LOC144148286 [Haemaphysalis longicornis]